MEIEHITSFLFAVHLALLCVKIWSTFIIFGWFTAVKSPNGAKYMLVYKASYFILFLFSALMLAMEIYFLYSFFIELDLYFYEYTAVLDEIIFTIIAISYLKKEENNG